MKVRQHASKARIEAVIQALKYREQTDVPGTVPFGLPDSAPGKLVVITDADLHDSVTIGRLAKWREKANVWYPAQFPVTIEGTKRWAEHALLRSPDRILFYIFAEGTDEPVGHVGLYRFDYAGGSAEIDNVIRGVFSANTRGIMTAAIRSLQMWSRKYLQLNHLELRVYSDNERALELYRRTGFREIARTRLYLHIEEGVSSWVDNPEAGVSTDRYFVTMSDAEPDVSEQRMMDRLEKTGAEVRADILRMAYRAQSAHLGGALSVVDILVALYFQVLTVDPKNHLDPRRDRLVFSKAHDAKALFATLARRGFFPVRQLSRYEVDNAVLPGHSTRHCVPGVEASAGSLGHGLSIGTGLALAAKLAGRKFRSWVILSDGECDEGATWEAALFAAHHKLDNLTAIVDYNGLQGYGYVKEILNLEPFADKWRSFGWDVRTIDGHAYGEMVREFSSVPATSGRPTVFIAKTTKGLGGPPEYVNQVSSQYKPPSEADLDNLSVRV